MKQCTKCKDVKEFVEFNKQPSKWNTDGYHQHCRKCKSASDRERYLANKEKYKERSRNYSKSSPEAVRATKRKYWASKKDDIQFKLRHSLASRLQYAYKSRGLSKNKKTSNVLGCTYEYLVQHIESQFEPWMNESNYGKCIPGQPNVGWDIDHIIPLASAETEDDLIRLCHYMNLQPICSNYNRYIKRDRLQN